MQDFVHQPYGDFFCLDFGVLVVRILLGCLKMWVQGISRDPKP